MDSSIMLLYWGIQYSDTVQYQSLNFSYVYIYISNFFAIFRSENLKMITCNHHVLFDGQIFQRSSASFNTEPSSSSHKESAFSLKKARDKLISLKVDNTDLH